MQLAVEGEVAAEARRQWQPVHPDRHVVAELSPRRVATPVCERPGPRDEAPHPDGRRAAHPGVLESRQLGRLAATPRPVAGVPQARPHGGVEGRHSAEQGARHAVPARPDDAPEEGGQVEGGQPWRAEATRREGSAQQVGVVGQRDEAGDGNGIGSDDASEDGVDIGAVSDKAGEHLLAAAGRRQTYIEHGPRPGRRLERAGRGPVGVGLVQRAQVSTQHVVQGRPARPGGQHVGRHPRRQTRLHRVHLPRHRRQQQHRRQRVTTRSYVTSGVEEHAHGVAARVAPSPGEGQLQCRGPAAVAGVRGRPSVQQGPQAGGVAVCSSAVQGSATQPVSSVHIGPRATQRRHARLAPVSRRDRERGARLGRSPARLGRVRVEPRVHQQLDDPHAARLARRVQGRHAARVTPAAVGRRPVLQQQLDGVDTPTSDGRVQRSLTANVHSVDVDTHVPTRTLAPTITIKTIPCVQHK